MLLPGTPGKKVDCLRLYSPPSARPMATAQAAPFSGSGGDSRAMALQGSKLPGPASQSVPSASGRPSTWARSSKVLASSWARRPQPLRVAHSHWEASRQASQRSGGASSGIKRCRAQASGGMAERCRPRLSHCSVPPSRSRRAVRCHRCSRCAGCRQACPARGRSCWSPTVAGRFRLAGR